MKQTKSHNIPLIVNGNFNPLVIAQIEQEAVNDAIEHLEVKNFPFEPCKVLKGLRIRNAQYQLKTAAQRIADYQEMGKTHDLISEYMEWYDNMSKEHGTMINNIEKLAPAGFEYTDAIHLAECIYLVKFNKTVILYLNTQTQETPQPAPTQAKELPTNDEGLKAWIYTKSIALFREIEQELFERGYIDERYQWINTKVKLIDFCTILMDTKEIFRPMVESNRKKDFHYRQFIAERYYKEKTALSETHKKHKPTPEQANASYFWLGELFKKHNI